MTREAGRGLMLWGGDGGDPPRARTGSRSEGKPVSVQGLLQWSTRTWWLKATEIYSLTLECVYTHAVASVVSDSLR